MRIKRIKGFSLIEIMLVVIIIGILTAMVLPNLKGRGKQARLTAARSEIEANLSIALDLYELDVGRYPNSSEGLSALINDPGVDEWNGPYLKRKKSVPKDPWGNEYLYVSPGYNNKESYDLSSKGPDEIESEDDVTNWSVE